MSKLLRAHCLVLYMRVYRMRIIWACQDESAYMHVDTMHLPCKNWWNKACGDGGFRISHQLLFAYFRCGRTFTLHSHTPHTYTQNLAGRVDSRQHALFHLPETNPPVHTLVSCTGEENCRDIQRNRRRGKHRQSSTWRSKHAATTIMKIGTDTIVCRM